MLQTSACPSNVQTRLWKCGKKSNDLGRASLNLELISWPYRAWIQDLNILTHPLAPSPESLQALGRVRAPPIPLPVGNHSLISLLSHSCRPAFTRCSLQCMDPHSPAPLWEPRVSRAGNENPSFLLNKWHSGHYNRGSENLLRDNNKC